MGDHGATAIVPINFLLLIANVGLWALLLPWWATLFIVFPVAIAIGFIATDQYGGMQLSLFGLLGSFAAAIAYDAAQKQAIAKQEDLAVFPTLFWMIANAIGFLVALILVMMSFVAVVIAWETLRDRFLYRRKD